MNWDWTGIVSGGRRHGGTRRASLCGICLLILTGQPAGAGLVEQLRRGETVKIVALGDSLATGYELKNADRDAYPMVFRSLLQRRYRKAYIRLIGAGFPGDTASRGNDRLVGDVLLEHPDLVTVQFGGNDHGRRRSPQDFRRDLERIIGRIREAGPAEILLATPPIAEPETDTPMVKAVKDVGQALGVPVADFDRAIRQAGTGPLGSFPKGRHPTAWMHAVMGRELYRAFTVLAGDTGEFRVGIDGGGGPRDVPAGARFEQKVYVKAPTPGPVVVSLERDGVPEEHRVTADLGGKATAVFSVPTPDVLSRTRQQRLIAWARRGDLFACDLRWLSIAPVLEPRNAEGTLGSDRVALGAWQWRGLDDLSARFRAEYEPEALAITVTVRDDRLERSVFPNGHDSDGVEVYLDLRSRATQGRPYWDEGVVALYLRPATRDWEDAAWSSLEPLPKGWKPEGLKSTRNKDGYEISARLPLAALRQRQAQGQETIGFDLAVNDADERWGRQSQMIWAGNADDYLDPSLYAAVSLRPRPDGKPGLRVIVR